MHLNRNINKISFIVGHRRIVLVLDNGISMTLLGHMYLIYKQIYVLQTGYRVH